MKNCATITCPMDPNSKLFKDDDSPKVNAIEYWQLIGSLLYLVNTCLDLSYAMSNLSQFSSQPCRSYWQVVLQVLCYLHGTLDFGINYASGGILIGCTKVDWDGCINTHHSMFGHCFMFGTSLISWRSQKKISKVTHYFIFINRI